MKLDLSKVRIVSRDGDTTTLKHYAGHEIRIVHKALSRENKDALECLHKIHQEKQDRKEAKRMAQGGEVNELGFPDRMTTSIPKEQATANKADTSTNASGPVRSKNRSEQNERMLQEGKSVQEIQADEKANPMAKGGRVRYADGGEVGPQEPSQRDIEAMINANAGNMQPQYIDQPQQQLQPPSMGQIAGDIGNVLMTPAGQPTAPIGQPRAAAQGPGMGMDQMPQMPNMGNSGGAQPVAQQPQDVNPNIDPSGNRQYTKDMLGGIDMQKQALELQYKAAAQQGAARAAADKTYMAHMQQAQNDFNAFNIKNQQHIDETIKDIHNNTINPKAYQENMTTGDKVATAIGMMAGGFGQAYVGGDNPAMTFLNKQIDRDIAAQKDNQGSRVTLLNAYQNQFRNQLAAADMTKATLNSLYASQLSLAANQAATPQAKAAMLAGVGQLQMKSAELVRSATLNEYMTNMESQNQGNPEKIVALRSMFDPQGAHELRQRMVPGIGFATTTEGAKTVRDAQVQTNNVKQGVKRLREILDTPGRSANLKLRAEADAIRSTLVGALRVDITGPGAMSDPERKMILGLIPDVTSLMSIDSNSKVRLDTIENKMDNGYRNTLQANGLQVPANFGRNPNEGKTAVNARGERIIMKNGQWTPYGQ